MEHKCLHVCTPENSSRVGSFHRSIGEESLLVWQKHAQEQREEEAQCCVRSRSRLKVVWIHVRYLWMPQEAGEGEKKNKKKLGISPG